MKVLSDEKALELVEKLLQNDKSIKEELEKKIPTNYLSSIPGEYVTEDEMNKVISDSLKNIDLDDYYDKTQVDNMLGEKAEKNDIPNIDGLATTEYVDNAIKNVDIYLTDYAKKEDIPTDYITTIPEEYVTTTEMEEAIANAQLGGEDINLTGYATETFVTDKISEIDIPDISNLVEKENGKGLFSGSYNDLTDKPTIPEAYDDSALVEMIEDVETSLGNKADKTELHTHTNKNILDGITNDKITSWDAKATEAFVTNAIAQAQLDGSDVDLSGLATKDDLNVKADKTHNHDDKYQPIGNYLTAHQDISGKADVGHKHVMSDITDYETPDLSGYALKTDIPTTLPASDVYDWAKAENKPTYTADEVGALPDTTVIPSIEGLATEEYVDNKINEAQFGVENVVDISVGNGLEIKYGNEINANDSIDNMPITNIDGEQYNLQVSSNGSVMALKPLPFKKTIYDIKPIPDLHNTGCHGELTNYLDLGIWTQKPSNTLLYFVKKSLQTHGSNVFENIDFDGVTLYFTQTPEDYGYSQIIFRNCRVNATDSEGNVGTYCVQPLNNKIELVFENCTFINGKAAVSNSTGKMTFKNCYANGFQGDCFKAGTDIKIINCYAAQAGLGEGAHADGIQFTSGSRFYVDNYRCDAIAIKDVNVYNAGFYIDFEAGDVTELEMAVAENIYVNGGGYTTYLVSAEGYTLKNIEMRNAQYGCSYRFKGISTGGGKYDEFCENGRYVEASTAYVTSVWKEDGVIKFCVTNYTNAERTLYICTSNGNTAITIPACPTYDEYYDTYTSVDQFPFNLEYEVADAEWFVVYDTTISEENQIRFVDFRFDEVASGNDGFSPIAKVEQTSDGAVITITDKNGTTTATVSNGKDGSGGGAVDESVIIDAVNAYMAENPVSAEVGDGTITIDKLSADLADIIEKNETVYDYMDANSQGVEYGTKGYFVNVAIPADKIVSVNTKLAAGGEMSYRLFQKNPDGSYTPYYTHTFTGVTGTENLQTIPCTTLDNTYVCVFGANPVRTLYDKAPDSDSIVGCFMTSSANLDSTTDKITAYPDYNFLATIVVTESLKANVDIISDKLDDIRVMTDSLMIGRGNVLAVGKGEQFVYNSIKAAEQAANVGDVISIYPGTYIEDNLGTDKKLHFVGVDKNACIVTNGLSVKSKCPFNMCYGGSIKNLTIIETHEEPYDTAESVVYKAYCVHADGESLAGGEVLIENCIMKNKYFSCIGAGLWQDFTLTVKDCEFHVYDSNPNETIRNYGAVYVHGNTTAGTTGQVIRIHNCHMRSTTNSAFRIDGTTLNGSEMSIELIGNTCYSDEFGVTDIATVGVRDGVTTLLPTSHGNNQANMNYQNSSDADGNDVVYISEADYLALVANGTYDHNTIYVTEKSLLDGNEVSY